MNCQEFEVLLQRRLDGEVTSPSEREAHLGECTICAERWAAAERLLRALESPRRFEVPSDCQHLLIRHALRQHSRRRLVRRVLVGAALAASLILAVLAVQQFGGRFNRDAAWIAPATPTTMRQVDKITDQSTPLRESMSEVKLAVASLTSRTADQAADQARFWLPLVPDTSLVRLDLPSTPDSATRSLRQAGHGVSAGLEPVTSSARKAMDLFLRDLPPLDVEAKGGS